MQESFSVYFREIVRRITNRRPVNTLLRALSARKYQNGVECISRYLTIDYLSGSVRIGSIAEKEKNVYSPQTTSEEEVDANITWFFFWQRQVGPNGKNMFNFPRVGEREKWKLSFCKIFFAKLIYTVDYVTFIQTRR